MTQSKDNEMSDSSTNFCQSVHMNINTSRQHRYLIVSYASAIWYLTFSNSCEVLTVRVITG